MPQEPANTQTAPTGLTAPVDVERHAALTHLLDEHGGKIYGLGLRMCGSPQEAEDLVQDTFLHALRKWDQFEGRAEASSWLYTIASRACWRRQRRKAGEPAEVASLSDLLPARDATIPDLDAEGPFAQQARREAIAQVHEAITQLPIEFRLPLVLKEIVELDIQQVAEILGVKPATVKTRLHRARLKLRQTLAAHLPQQTAPPPDHERAVCLDLLHAKQEAMDRGVDFPLASSELCQRCQSLFATLDLTREVCQGLLDGAELPPPLRQAVESRF